MIISSTLILTRDDLKEESKGKSAYDIRPSDFKDYKVRNLIKDCKIVIYKGCDIQLIVKSEYCNIGCISKLKT